MQQERGICSGRVEYAAGAGVCGGSGIRECSDCLVASGASQGDGPVLRAGERDNSSLNTIILCTCIVIHEDVL